MLSPELERFCNEWLIKADQYSDQSVDDCYDKFFTLFVVFSRLYAEATFERIRLGQVTVMPNRSLPDRKGATDHTFEMIGLQNFQALYNAELATPVNELIHLIQTEQFYIKLSSPNGDRQRDKDLVLLASLQSTGKKQLLAILDLVYTVRCNLFHGHKAFQPV